MDQLLCVREPRRAVCSCSLRIRCQLMSDVCSIERLVHRPENFRDAPLLVERREVELEACELSSS